MDGVDVVTMRDDEADMAEAPASGGRYKPGNPKGDSGDRDQRGRITGRSKQTRKQQVFGLLLAKGVRQTKAAELAGYRHPDVAAAKMLRTGHTAELIRRGKRRLISENASLGVVMIRDILSGRAQATRLELDAARYAIDLEQRLEQAAAEGNETGALRDLSLRDLEAMADRLNKAKVVATVPELPADAVQVLENTGSDTP